MSLRARVYGFLAVAAALCGAGYFFLQQYEFDGMTVKARAETKDEDQAEQAAVPVEVETAERGTISSRVRSTSNLRALRDVVLKPQTPGQIVAVLVEEGAAVRSGQLLCRLDDRELQVSLELARSRLEQTRIQLEGAKIQREKNGAQVAAKKADLERNEQALSEGLVSEVEVTMLRNQLAELGHDGRAQEASVRESESRVQELESEIDRVKVQIADTAITAPFAGRITERTVELGQSVGTNDNLFRLASFSPLYADAFISELDSRSVVVGQTATLSLGAAGDETAEGRVVRISPVVDDNTGTVKVTVELEPRGAAYRPGAFVRVEIATDTREQALLIPKRAVLEEDGQTFVFVTDHDIAERREIELGFSDGAAVEALSGVSPGEVVVVAGQGALKEGDKTRIVGE
jgi:RND family efflux transporter MFP subunit